MSEFGVGLHRMSAAEYHADPAPAPSLSSSIAKRLITHSPLHAWTDHRRLNPNYTPEERDAFDLGSAAHALLLEGEDRMQVIPAKDFKTAAAQALRDAARSAGRHPILEGKYPKVMKMREAALRAIAACVDLGGITLADGTAEPTAIWQEGAAWCRARLDWLSNDRRLILDYKTTAASAHPDAWVKTMAGLAGEVQAAFYLRGNEATGGPEGARFVFIVQEVSEPFACSLLGMPPAFLALGAAKVEEAVELWKRATEANTWPAYPDRICWLEPPPWLITQWENRGIGVSPEESDPVTA